MGYTHYWEGSFTDAEWKLMRDSARKILELTDVPVQFDCDEPGDPVIDDEHIRFNGVGDDDGHETFMLTKSGAWTFCKTARKPYDEVVVAMLLAADDIAKDFSWSSDGSGYDFAQGEALYARTFEL
jgi:hypothetical protein